MSPDSPLITPPPAADAPGTEPGRPSPWPSAVHPGYGAADAGHPPDQADQPDKADQPNQADPWNGGHTPRQSWFKRRIAPIGAAIIALAAKLKAVLLLLPKLKLLASAGTMLVSIVAYTTIWGLPFAVGIVLLLLVHEMGHVFALRREGIPASAPMFIPFLGAVITSKSLGDNAAAEARVGLAGPILGSLGAAVCIVVWRVTGHDFWRALAFFGLFLNLFNLLPVVPLDGGRAMAAMAPWMWGVGLVVMVGLAIAFPNPVLLIIVVFAAYETWRRWKLRKTRSLEQAAYYRVRPRDRKLIAAVYLGLIVLLAVGMDITHLQRAIS